MISGKGCRKTWDLVWQSGKNKVAVLQTPLHICQQRDVKGLYAKAKLNSGLQLTGIGAPYEAPTNADCVIDTSQIELTTATQQLRAFLKE